MTSVPGAREVREEDAFDVPGVADWLRAHAVTPDGLEGEPEVRQFTGGASNLTYLLRYPSGRDLIVRRAPAGTKARGAHDMHREYAIQSALAPVFDYVAPMVAFCDDPDVVGGLVERSRITADDIAAAVLAGMDAGEDVIVPDEPARQAYFLKWADRPAYDAVMRDQAAKLQAAGS